MIFFFTTDYGRHTIDEYLVSMWGRPFTSLIQVIPYDNFSEHQHILPGIYIFTDIERLNQLERQHALNIANTIKRNNYPVLNQPDRMLDRLALQQQLVQENINPFRTFKINERDSMTYPVFLRSATDHKGPTSDLLQNEAELQDRVKFLNRHKVNIDDYLVVEFFDTADADKIYRKYSAFYVDGKVIPRHMFFSRFWIVKIEDIVNAEFQQEEQAYLSSNPHQAEIQEIFKLAHIDYGRVDYSLFNGKLIVWEINTNPMVLTHKMEQSTLRRDSHDAFARQLNIQWQVLLAKAELDRGGYLLETIRNQFYRFKQVLRNRRRN